MPGSAPIGSRPAFAWTKSGRTRSDALQARLADEVAQDRGGAQPAQAGGGKGHAL